MALFHGRKIQECMFGHLDAHNFAAIYQAIRRSPETQILKFARVSFPRQGEKDPFSTGQHRFQITTLRGQQRDKNPGLVERSYGKDSPKAGQTSLRQGICLPLIRCLDKNTKNSKKSREFCLSLWVNKWLRKGPPKHKTQGTSANTTGGKPSKGNDGC